MINRDAVIYAYRLLLGREPEDERVVSHYATEMKDVRALRELFINSPEFREKMLNWVSTGTARPSFAAPPMDVELDVAPEQLARLFQRTAAQWQHLGETEPHWSVLTNDNYFQGKFNSNKEAFYASGESECRTFISTLARAGIALDKNAVCLELGCGVGRVTAALATRAANVIGVDISSAHLQLAAEYLREKAIANVSLRHLDRMESLAGFGPFDVLYSRIVLQHNPPPTIQWMLRELLGKLRPGGIAYFQVPVYRNGYSFRVSEYLAQSNVTNMEVHFYPQPALFRLLAEQGCTLLELREDDSIGLPATALSNTVLVRKG